MKELSVTDQVIIRTMRVVQYGVLFILIGIIALIVVNAIRIQPCATCAVCPTAEHP